MPEKRPSWRDILWTPIYDFVDERWGTRGLRLFAISIALVTIAVAWWGLNEIPQGFPELREHIDSAAAKWSGNITAMALFLSDILETGLRVMVRGNPLP
jgi:hypothetical protein